MFIQRSVFRSYYILAEMPLPPKKKTNVRHRAYFQSFGIWMNNIKEGVYFYNLAPERSEITNKKHVIQHVNFHYKVPSNPLSKMTKTKYNTINFVLFTHKITKN